MGQPAIDRSGIEAAYAVIRPHIRFTPAMDVSGADFNLPPFPLTFKL